MAADRYWYIRKNGMIQKEEVMNALRQCYDPEIPINVVDLGLIYDVQIEEGTIRVKMSLTAPGCPMAGFMVKDIEQKLKSLKGVKKAEVEIVWDPPWSPERISPEAKGVLGM
jgi:FeS assembly SUF system protein